jgi:hypothetical protein
MTDLKASNPLLRLSTFLVGLVPVIAFFLICYAYAYEAGIAVALGYPVEIIPFSISIVARFLLELTPFSLWNISLGWLAIHYWPHRQGSYYIFMVMAIIALNIQIMLFLYVSHMAIVYMLVLVAPVGWGINVFLWRDKSVSFMPNAYDVRGDQPLPNSISKTYLDYWGVDLSLLFFLLFIFNPGGVFLAGMLFSQSQVADRFVQVLGETYGLVRIVGDFLVVKEVDSALGGVLDHSSVKLMKFEDGITFSSKLSGNSFSSN